MGKIFDRSFIGVVVWILIGVFYNLNEYIVNQIGVETWQQNTLFIIYTFVLVYATGFVCEKTEKYLNKN